MTLTHGSMFTGIGGFEVGFGQAGITTAWMAEYDPTPHGKQERPTPMGRQWPVRVLRRHFPEVPNLGDITKIHWPPTVDVVSLGSPCQDLSVAGQRAGITGSRSGLFFEAARVIEECRPTFAIWENVPGAFSSHDGRDFGMVLHTLVQLGASDIAWRVFDSQYAGVPQQRRRLYLVADFGGRRAAEVLFDPGRCSGHPSPFGPEGEGAAGALTGGAYGAGRPGGSHDTDLVSKPRGLVSPAMTSKWAKGSGGPAGDEVQNLTLIQDVRGGADTVSQQAFVPAYARGHAGPPGDQAPALTADADRGDQQALVFDPTQITSPDNRSQPRPGAPSHTLPTHGSAPAIASHGTIRRFTPLECERLQGFPDGWTCLCGAEADMFACRCPDGPRYRAIGNAVTTTIPEWLAYRIREVLGR